MKKIMVEFLPQFFHYGASLLPNFEGLDGLNLLPTNRLYRIRPERDLPILCMVVILNSNHPIPRKEYFNT